MKTTKLISLIIAILMLIPMAAACTDNTAATTTAPTSDKTDTTTAPTETETGTKESKTTLYVSENGNDGNAGTADAPLASFAGAVAKISGISGDVDVIFEKGTYIFDGTVTLPSDVFSERHVNFIGNGEATLSGGIYFAASDFEPLSGDFAERFPEEARENIVMLDLTKYGIDADEIYNLSTTDKSVYLNDERLCLSRYPNLKNGERDTGFVYIDKYTILEDGGGHTITLRAINANRVASWTDYDEVDVFGYFARMWASSHQKIGSFDPETRVLYLPGLNWADERMPFCFYNIPEELDAAGEFYISKDGVLYIYKTEDFESATVTVPLLKTDFFAFDNASNVTFDGFTVEAGRASVFNGTVDYLTVQNCIIRNTFNVALLNGTNILITRNEIYNATDKMIEISGGDKLNLVSSNNVISYNDIHDWDLASNSYRAAISMGAVGGVVSHNAIHDSCFSAGGIGLLCLAEYNEIYNVCMFTDDIGAFGAGGMIEFGGTIRYNYFHDIGKQSIARTGTAAIYCDNNANCANLYGNIINNVVGRGFLIGGGRAFNIIGNLVMNCSMCGYTYDDRGIIYDEGAGMYNGHKYMMRFAKLPYCTSEIWQQTFPWITTINYDPDQTDIDAPGFPGNPGDSVVKDNVYVMTKGETGMYNKLTGIDKKEYHFDVYPRVYQYSEVEEVVRIPTDKKQLTIEDVLALDLPDFIDIPFEEIGLK